VVTANERHVLVESNWVVAVAAHAHHRVPDAANLLKRAEAGELILHLPAVCLNEARNVLETQGRFKAREEARAIRDYVRWARAQGDVDEEQAATVLEFTQRMETKLSDDRAALPERLDQIANAPGVELFPLDEEMLRRSLSIGREHSLKPFDQAILAGVLVRGARLAVKDVHVCFLTLDADLQPWGKHRERKEPLGTWYDRAKIWVYGDFNVPEPPDPWP
jgi:predicted nucleic acid-binding protein